MEFSVLAHLLKGLIEGIDRLFQKSLRQAILDLDLLLEDPRKALDHREIVIGPCRRFFTALIAGLATAFVAMWVLMLLLLLLQTFLGMQHVSPKTLISALVVVIPVSFLWALRVLRGGYCVLTQQGVEFSYQNRVVRCGWPVFYAYGAQVYLEGSGLLLLPICPDAVGFITELNSKDGTLRFSGLQVRTPQWETRSPTEAALKPLYVVDLKELGGLLVTLGQVLGPLQPSTSGPKALAVERSGDNSSLTEGRSHAIAIKEKSGWIRMSLTNLHFPPYCCLCLSPTTATHVFRCPNPGEGGELKIPLPACDQCRQKMRRTKSKVIFSLALVALVILYILLVSLNAFPAREIAVIVVVCLILIVSVTWIFTSIRQQYFGHPVKVRYTSEKGTLRLRFRNQEFERVLLSMRQLSQPLRAE